MLDISGLPCRCADSTNTRWRPESDSKNRNGSLRRTSPNSRDGDIPRGTNQYRRRVESGSKGEHRAQVPKWASVAASGKSLNPLVSNFFFRSPPPPPPPLARNETTMSFLRQHLLAISPRSFSTSVS